MQPYFGLRGALLNRAIIWLVVCPAFLCYGYNQGVTGGLLTLKSFSETFPEMNTLTTTGEEQRYNSTIQGNPPLISPPGEVALLLTGQARWLPCTRWEESSGPSPASTWATYWDDVASYS